MKLRYPHEEPEDCTIHLAFNFEGLVGVYVFMKKKWVKLKSRDRDVMKSACGIIWLSDREML
jgi:hypothetical protein